jgi:CheY-like chemotaxis protein
LAKAQKPVTKEVSAMSYQRMYNQDSSLSAVARDGHRLILSVDDDLTVLYTRYKLLSSAGYTVLSASDAVQALQLFGEHTVDLVLLDYALPEMDGGMLADAMKTHRPDIPIIMVSGVEVPEKVLETVDGYVRKGDAAQLLMTSIEKALKDGGKPAGLQGVSS